MNTQEVINEVKKLPIFNGLELTEPGSDSQHGTIAVDCRTFKDSGKNEYMLGGHYNFFLAHMYKGETKREFFYLIFERPAQKRIFRQHSFNTIEWNKIYASGKTVSDLMEDLNNQLEGYELL